MNKIFKINNKLLTILKVGIFFILAFIPSVFAREPFDEELPSEGTRANSLYAENIATSGLRAITVDPDDPNYDPNGTNGVGEVPVGDIIPPLFFIAALGYGVYVGRKQSKEGGE